MSNGPRGRSRHPLVRRIVVLTTAVLLGSVFVGLGAWQLQRRAWKLALIAQVDARIHAPAAPPPGPSAWPAISRARDAYRHVRLTGRWVSGRDTLVQAATDLGAGYWVMTPLQTPEGYVVLVNRGFVPPDRKTLADPPAASGQTPIEVRGLLRISEPGGGFLRANNPAQDRWYSRDVAAIVAKRGLGRVAPYFVDADAGRSGTQGPVGGLTVVAFPNNHLAYALTWFTLAAMVAGATPIVLREQGPTVRIGEGP